MVFKNHKMKWVEKRWGWEVGIDFYVERYRVFPKEGKEIL
jgi:hypothetical protein